MSYQVVFPGYRPYSGAGTVLYVTSTGSDSLGNGTVTYPFLTVERALRESGVNQTTTINVGPGTFDHPGSISGGGNPTINGTLSDSAVTGVVDAVGTTTGAGAFTLDITLSIGAVGANALRATLYRFTSGAANGRYFWILENLASGATTTVYGVQDVGVSGSNPIAPAPGDTFVQMSFDTTLNVTGTLASIDSRAVFQFFRITSTSAAASISVNNDAAWVRCLIQIGQRIQVSTTLGPFAKIQLIGCYYQPRNSNSVVGALTLADGVLRISRGTALDFSQCTANCRFVRAIGGAGVSSADAVVLSTCEGIRLNASFWTITGQSYAVRDGWSFLPSSSQAWSLNAGATARPDYGGEYALPPTYGQITGNYLVVARFRAQVSFLLLGSLTTALGVNVVSADNGTSTRAIAPDGTIILGASPTRTIGAFTIEPVSVIAAGAPLSVDAQPFSHHFCDPSAFAVTIDFPLNPLSGDVIVVSNDTNSVANAITINGNGANIADPTTPGTYVASVAVSVAGFIFRWRYNGTRWMEA